MQRPTDMKRVLAEEIRAAIAEAAPGPGESRGRESTATAAARAPLVRAEELLTPSVPSGAPLETAKRLLIRALRFLWRNQSAFNALSLEATGGLAEAVDRLHRSVEELSRGVGIRDGRIALLETAGPGARTAGPPPRPPAPSASFPAGVYALFEERFRGAPGEIAAAQRAYLDLLRDIPGPVLDVGCGRGEFLKLLAAEGIPARGVESNPVTAPMCRREGLDVEEADALAFLAGLPPGRLGAVVAFQVVEHWRPEVLFRYLQEARRVLAPGGLLVAETINTDSISALKAFYLDPTHVRPVPPEALQFLAEAAGFTEVRVEYRSPLPAAGRLTETSDNERKLNALLFAAQDYAVIARAPAAP